MTRRREELHRLIDELCDAEERAAAINGEDEAAGAREEVFDKLKPLMNLLGRDILRERMGAARMPRLPFASGSKHSSSALEVANDPVPADIRDPQFINMYTNAFSRQMLACFALDFEDILPDNLARNVAVALLELNNGGVLPLFEPIRYKNMPDKKVIYARYVHIVHVYYTKGFYNCTVSIAIDIVNKNNPDADRPLKEDTIYKWVQRLGAEEQADLYSKIGADDAAAKKPYAVPDFSGSDNPFGIEVSLGSRLKRKE